MSRARKTTVAHMKRLAAAALVTNVASCEHMCTSGYAVVDPMPPPARVPGVAASIVGTASFSGARIVLELKNPTYPSATFAAKTALDAGAPGYSIANGRVASTTPTTDGIRLEVEPSPGVASFYVTFDIDGTDGGSVQATVSWGTSLDGGREVGVSLNDR
jgi:hypothetical protein